MYYVSYKREIILLQRMKASKLKSEKKKTKLRWEINLLMSIFNLKIEYNNKFNIRTDSVVVELFSFVETAWLLSRQFFPKILTVFIILKFRKRLSNAP